MSGSAAQVTVREAANNVSFTGLLRLARIYRWPLLALLVGVPIVTVAAVRSWGWLGATFPGFLLMDNAIVPTVSGINWPRDKAELFHSQIVAVDGTPVRTSGDVYGLVAGRPPGTEFTYTIRKGTRVVQLALPSLTFSVADYLQVYGILLMIALLALCVGVVVGFMQPGKTQARLYLLLSTVVGIWAASAVFLHQAGPRLLTVLYFVAEAFFPAALTHLALHFPTERRFTGTWRACPVVPYALSAVLAVSVLIGFYAQPPTLWALHATYLYTAGSFLFSVAAMLYAYWENRDPRARLRVKVILPNFILGGTLMVFAFTNNAIAGGDFPMQLGVLLVPLVFISVAYAIVKHDLFDIDRFVRQSFVYGVVSIIVISAYALVLVIPARFVPSLTGDNQALLGMAFVLVLAFALNPLRSVVQRLVDRAFYRTRLDYRATISGLSRIMTSLLDLREVASQVTQVVTDAMHLESTTLCLFEPDEVTGTLWSRRAEGELNPHAIPLELGRLRQGLHQLPQAFDTTALADPLEPLPRTVLRDLLHRTGATVGLQLVLGGQPIGLLLLGAKRSGQLVTSDDIDLLRTLANQTAIAVQNARSYDDLEELTRDLDAKIQQQARMFQLLQDREARLAEAVQDKDRLYQESLRYQRNLQSLSRRMMQVSERTMQRIAHELHDDLGQALTSVKMQLGLIERSVPEESALRPSLAEARNQVGGLLQSVRQLSQLLRPAVLDDLGLVPAMQSYVGRFTARTEIAVALDCPPTETRFPAPIEVALYRVLQEALTNIARHAEAHRVAVTLIATDEHVTLRITDDGRGFDADTYLENPPAGHGMGVLGMRERVATYGGKFVIRSQPGQGATVELTISLTEPIQELDDDHGENTRLAG